MVTRSAPKAYMEYTPMMSGCAARVLVINVNRTCSSVAGLISSTTRREGAIFRRGLKGTLVPFVVGLPRVTSTLPALVTTVISVTA